ncbi:MAG: hypothetical protein HYZ37_04110 [Candidatus Solibacter usitatus]|nr:hypothetical protein [Candidatus Solibacter usitatus]
MRLKLATGILLLGGAASLSAETLADLSARMDLAAASFRGMTSKLKRISYTAVIKDTSEDAGSIAMKVSGKSDMHVRVDFATPDEKTWAFRGRKAELYIPKINTVQEYDLGKHGRLIDQFLLLGFGTKSRELAKSYHMKHVGVEQLDGAAASKLELVPKSEEALKHLKRVEIWFPAGGGSPVRQKFYLGSGDYMLVMYWGMKLEANLPDSAVRLALPANVKREFPGR